jgi:hypothetical protein
MRPGRGGKVGIAVVCRISKGVWGPEETCFRFSSVSMRPPFPARCSWLPTASPWLVNRPTTWGPKRIDTFPSRCSAAMNSTVSWGDRVTAYLLYRRSLGFSLMPESLYSPQFARFAEQKHAPRLTVQLATDWACTSKRQTSITRAHRTMRLRGFAKYCQRFDPDGRFRPLVYLGERVVVWCPIFVPSRS